MEKYRIIANKEQLHSIGIDYELSGLEGVFKRKYVATKYIQLEVKHNIGSFEFVNSFDLPSSYLKLIKE